VPIQKNKTQSHFHGESKPQNLTKAWIIVLTAALFFLYEFIQMNMFNSLALSFESTFSLSAFQVALVSAFYFLSDSLLLYPAGVMLDRYSSKKLILLGMVLCILGTGLIAGSSNAWFLVISRFLSGTASAFCLLSILRLAASWFPPRKMGQVTGIVVTLGMLGGALSQTPLTLLIDQTSWREALLITALLGLFILILMIFLIKDAPEDHSHAALQSSPLKWFDGFYAMLINKYNWLAGLYICTMNLPIMLLAGLFGTQWMMQVHGFTDIQGSNISMMIFIGTILGSTVFGVWSDVLRSRKKPMLITALISLINFLIILYLPASVLDNAQNYYLYLILFLSLGFFTGSQIIGYPVIRETNQAQNIGTALGFASVIIMGTPALLQPLVGLLMNWHSQGLMIQGARIYSRGDYQVGLSILTIGFLISLYCACKLPETYGNNLNNLKNKKNGEDHS